MALKKKQYDYQRKRGNRPVLGAKGKSITFSWAKLDINQGQSIKDWEKSGLLSQLCEMMGQIGSYKTSEALANKLIKEYSKINGFPTNSEFKKLTHLSPVRWAVIHIKPNSKAVVTGYLDEDVFYIVFLDKEHKFWPSDIQSKGKTKR